MLRFAANEVLRLLLGLAGAVLLAAALAALSALALDTGLADSGVLAILTAWGTHLAAMAQGDFGDSLLTGQSALAALGQTLPATLTLLMLGLLLALLVGLPLGLVMGIRPVRRLAAPLFHMIAALPVFCASLLLAFAAYHVLGWRGPSHPAPLWPLPMDQDGWMAAVLPVATVGLAGAAAVQRALRGAIAREADADWPQALKKLGLGARDILFLYRLPRLLAGLLAASGKILLALLAAAVVAEWVFRCPGIAALMVKAAALGDGNLAALIVLACAALVLCVHSAGRLAGRALASEMIVPRIADMNIVPVCKPCRMHFGFRLLGWTILAVLAVVGLLHNFLSPAPLGAKMVGAMLSPPSFAFPFGTDVLGRDIYSETMHALSLTLGWSLAATLIAIIAGALFGAASARLPTVFAASLRWIVSVFASVPALVLAIVMIWFLSRGPVMAVAAGLAAAPIGFLRAYDRAEARGRAPYTEFARATGLSTIALLQRDIKAEIKSGLSGLVARSFAASAIIVSTVGFLGFGPPPPLRGLGAMIATAKEQYLTAWWTAAFPAVFLALLVLGARLAAGLEEGERP